MYVCMYGAYPASIVAYQSLLEDVLPLNKKSAIITLILKKADLDPGVAANYRHTSNLAFISKVNERIVASLLTALSCCK